MNIIISGSLAYDRIMDFPGSFSDHILPDKIHVLNVCFQVNGMKEKFGGTAGNIAYSLTLLGEKPLLCACIGLDYQRYFDWLSKNGIATDHIRIIQEEFTAGAYITTDRSDNQITGFNPGAMKYESQLNLDAFSPEDTLMIISPGNLDDMKNYPRACRRTGIRFIFDPGQSLPMWNAEDLMEAMRGSRILMVNDYELDLVMTKTGLDKQALLDLTGMIITTLGERGSRVTTREKEIDIPACATTKVEDPTGAGDAYRSGLLFGLARDLDIHQCAKMASACASFAVECYGTQEHAFTPEDFQAKLSTL
ncbi:MAG: carbohydrate kinase family protein [Smithellaceae bacterium]